MLRQRIRYRPYLDKIIQNPKDLAPLFKNGDYIGWSGFTGVGSPKVIPDMLAQHVEDNSLQGKLRFNLFVGASAGFEESRWAMNDMIIKRAPHQVGKAIASKINDGTMQFFDKHLSMFPQDLTYGFYSKNRDAVHNPREVLDYTIIEATAIKEDGSIVPGPSVGGSPEFIACSKNVIIELNTSIPSFEGLHDIDMPEYPPFKKPYLHNSVDYKVGVTGIPVDPNKVIAVVESTRRDKVPLNTPSDSISKDIAHNLIDFFQNEIKHGRLPENLHPLQSGIGNIANAVIEGLVDGNFKHLNVWTEVLQDSFLDLFENGSLDYATSTSIRLTEPGFQKFFDNWDDFSKKICLRSQVVSNNPEIIRRLGLIAMNTPVEFDIYGHANSTNVNGSRMLHGIGGSADFLRNAKLSIMHAPSVRPTKKDPMGISTVVPFASHIDQTEHDLDILVTEQGLADLRGLSPRERSREIITKCSHPYYRDMLMDYVNEAEFYCNKTKSMHEPHMLSKCFKVYENLQEKGSMKLDKW